MPKSRYPKTLSEWLREQGVKVKLADLLEVADRVLPIFIVNPPHYPGLISVAGGTIKHNAEELGAVTTKTWTVPSNKRWLIICGWTERDTSETIAVDVYDEDDNYLFALLHQMSAGTTNVAFPQSWSTTNYDVPDFPFPPILKAGDYVKVTWGGAQTSPKVSLTVLEVDE